MNPKKTFKATWTEFSKTWEHYECYVEANQFASDDEILDLAQESGNKKLTSTNCEHDEYQAEDVEEVKDD